MKRANSLNVLNVGTRESQEVAQVRKIIYPLVHLSTPEYVSGADRERCEERNNAILY